MEVFVGYRRQVLAALLFTIAVVPVCAQRKWKEVKSPNFSVVTDAGEHRGCEVARRLELFHNVLAALTMDAKHQESAPAPVQVILFRKRKELRRFAPLHEGKPIPAASLFARNADVNYIALDASSHNFWDNVGHEYTHTQVFGTLAETPLWLDEGFAQFYSTAKPEGDEARIGSPPKGTAAALRFKHLWRIKLWPVERLFAVTVDSPEYANRRRRPLFYAQSWLLVHMLVMSGKIDQARTYASLRSQGAGIAESINQAFHLTPAQLDLALEEYRKHVDSLAVPVPAPEEEAPCSTRELAPIEVAVSLAEFHAHEPGYEELATAELEAVLRQEPDNPRAHAALGFLSFRRGDGESARRHYERALQLDPANPRAAYYRNFVQGLVGDSPEAEDVATMPARPGGVNTWVGPRPPAVPGNREEAAVEFDPREIQYARGRLLDADCSSWPRVHMRLLIAGRAWAVEVADATKLLLLNADSFSCSWADREVSVNFRWRTSSVADAVSLELLDAP